MSPDQLTIDHVNEMITAFNDADFEDFMRRPSGAGEILVDPYGPRCWVTARSVKT